MSRRINLCTYLHRKSFSHKQYISLKRERKHLENKVDKIRHLISKLDIKIMAHSKDGDLAI